MKMLDVDVKMKDMKFCSAFFCRRAKRPHGSFLSKWNHPCESALYLFSLTCLRLSGEISGKILKFRFGFVFVFLIRTRISSSVRLERRNQ